MKAPLRYKLLFALCVMLLTSVVIEGACYLLLGTLGTEVDGAVRFTQNEVWQHHKSSLHVLDRDLFWRLKSGHSEAQVSINSLGFRGAEFQLPKPIGTYRIALLGDSITFGYRLAEKDSYAAQLALALRQSLPSTLEVVNAGTVGYTSWQGRILYEKVISGLAADVVVIMYGYNDHHSALISDRERNERKQLNFSLSLLERSATFRFIAKIRGADIPELRREPLARVSLTEFEENISELTRRAESDGAKVLVLTVPLRRSMPLIENFRALQFAAQSETVWSREADIVARELGSPLNGIIERHFFNAESWDELGVKAEDCSKILGLTQKFSTLPLPHYLAAACLREQGDNSQASKQTALWQALDSERATMQQYNERLRMLARELRITLVDMARLFEEQPGDEDLFLDVVHPSPAGHRLIARALADALRQIWGH